MQNEEGDVEVPVEEDLLAQETPVDRPLEEELSRKFERPTQVAPRIFVEERHRDDDLYQHHEHQESERRV